jgi:hypothetical protein
MGICAALNELDVQADVNETPSSRSKASSFKFWNKERSTKTFTGVQTLPKGMTDDVDVKRKESLSTIAAGPSGLLIGIERSDSGPPESSANSNRPILLDPWPTSAYDVMSRRPSREDIEQRRRDSIKALESVVVML